MTPITPAHDDASLTSSSLFVDSKRLKSTKRHKCQAFCRFLLKFKHFVTTKLSMLCSSCFTASSSPDIAVATVDKLFVYPQSTHDDSALDHKQEAEILIRPQQHDIRIRKSIEKCVMAQTRQMPLVLSENPVSLSSCVDEKKPMEENAPNFNQNNMKVAQNDNKPHEDDENGACDDANAPSMKNYTENTEKSSSFDHFKPLISDNTVSESTSEPETGSDTHTSISDTSTGYDEWIRRRSIWTEGSFSVNPKPSTIEGIPKDRYLSIYNVLVKNPRPLKQPMNLEDAIKVIKAGWEADGTWPKQ